MNFKNLKLKDIQIDQDFYNDEFIGKKEKIKREKPMNDSWISQSKGKQKRNKNFN